MTTVFDRVGAVLSRINQIQSRMHELGQAASPATGAARPSFASQLWRMPTAHAGKAPPAGLEGMITRAATTHNVRPQLLRAVVQVESGFNPRAVSPKGAQGLMQLMPGTSAALGVSDPFDPEQNLMAGARYLRQNLDRFGGDERLALAAYNAGSAPVQRYGGVPPYPETQQYVRNVLALSTHAQ
jgi:soluble lytic murein transglycosylase-like protein